MTNEEIFKKAIEKAVKSGWDKFGTEHYDIIRCVQHSGYYGIDYWIEPIIFSRDFAKAFWGTEMVRFCSSCYHTNKESVYQEGTDECNNCRGSGWHGVIAWQYYLARAVLEPEPLKYIERFLNT